MGISSDAILAYGYDLGEDFYTEDKVEGYDVVYHLTDKLLASFVGFTDEWTVEDTTFWKRKGEAQKLLGLEVITHCSYDYPMYFLATTSTWASRGSPERIESLEVNPMWDDRLATALKVLGIEPKEKFGWHLFSVMG